MAEAIRSLQKLIAKGEASPILIRFAACEAATSPIIKIRSIFVDIASSLNSTFQNIFGSL